MEDIGYACTSSGASFKELLSQFPKLKEQDVASILGVMSRTHTTTDTSSEEGIQLYTTFPSATPATTPDTATPPTSWNVNIFVDTIKELYPKLNWPLVIRHLDHPGFLLLDQKGLALIMSIFRKATKEQFPLDVLFDDVWTNTTGKLLISVQFTNNQPRPIKFPETSIGSSPRCVQFCCSTSQTATN